MIIKGRKWDQFFESWCLIKVDSSGEVTGRFPKSCAKSGGLMQLFTGKVDIKLKEIFEGDIVEDSLNLRYVIVWEDMYARFSMKPLFPFDEKFRGHDIKELRIVGNTTETPELLK